MLLCLLVATITAVIATDQTTPKLSFSAGFSDDSVLQRSAFKGARIYGFATTNTKDITVSFSSDISSVMSTFVAAYSVPAEISAWVDTSGCNATGCIDPGTPISPNHGNFTWMAELQPHASAGGAYLITVSMGGRGGVNESISLERVTYGDVYFCSGQSNMALETYYTFSADTLKVLTHNPTPQFLTITHVAFRRKSVPVNIIG